MSNTKGADRARNAKEKLVRASNGEGDAGRQGGGSARDVSSRAANGKRSAAALSARALQTESAATGSADALYDPEYAELVARQLELLGEDIEREGLRRTPVRVARAMRWLTRGYELDVERVVGQAVFEADTQNMVMVRDIELYSLCEHHMLPFFGKAHVAYIPNKHIVGLSKLPRIVEVFARRLQVQERLTEEVAQAVETVLRPKGVGVVIEAYHLCMMMRGVEKQNSKTITSSLRGAFRDDAKTRDEFLRLAHSPTSPLR
jgi:GTP cyclohydrolase I